MPLPTFFFALSESVQLAVVCAGCYWGLRRRLNAPAARQVGGALQDLLEAAEAFGREAV